MAGMFGALAPNFTGQSMGGTNAGMYASPTLPTDFLRDRLRQIIGDRYADRIVDTGPTGFMAHNADMIPQGAMQTAAGIRSGNTAMTGMGMAGLALGALPLPPGVGKVVGGIAGDVAKDAGMFGITKIAQDAAQDAVPSANATLASVAKPVTGKSADALAAFKKITGRDYGTAATDIPLVGRGDITLPPGRTLSGIQDHVDELTNDVKQWNNPQRRMWYENSGNAINTATGKNAPMAERLTYGISKTSQGTPVLDNAAYAIKGHNQAMVGDPVKTGRFPAVMGSAIQDAYDTGDTAALGSKIGGYQSGFRSSWVPDLNNAGANDLHNMRWFGHEGFDGTPTTGHHNYDRIVRSAITDRLNSEGYDAGLGAWNPGQVQAVGWAKARAAGGVPEDQAGYDIANAFKDRTARLTYETAPGLTTNHMPEYHAAPYADKQAYHDAINQTLTDNQGRDIITSHMGLLTMPTEHGTGVFQGAASPGSHAQALVGQAPGGWKNGIDPASKELLDASEAVRGILLRQDAVAYHHPVFPENGLTGNNTNLFDVRTGASMTPQEAMDVSAALKSRTGTDFHSPIFTQNGYRFINHPEASGVSNKAFQGHLQNALTDVYGPQSGGDIKVVMGHSEGNYIPNDWSKNGAQDYLSVLRGARPDVQRRAAELLSTLGPRVSSVEDSFAKSHGWTPDKATRAWEGLDTPQVSSIGSMPAPWDHPPPSVSNGLFGSQLRQPQ